MKRSILTECGSPACLSEYVRYPKLINPMFVPAAAKHAVSVGLLVRVMAEMWSCDLPLTRTTKRSLIGRPWCRQSSCCWSGASLCVTQLHSETDTAQRRRTQNPISCQMWYCSVADDICVTVLRSNLEGCFPEATLQSCRDYRTSGWRSTEPKSLRFLVQTRMSRQTHNTKEMKKLPD